jgi:hypothetical protein
MEIPNRLTSRTPTPPSRGDHRSAIDLAEEVDHVLGAAEPRQIAVNDDAVEAVINEGQQVAEQPGEEFHGQHHHAPDRS